MELGAKKLPQMYISIEHDTLTHMEDISIMSPGDDTQSYDCYHENKVTRRVWSFMNDVSGIGIPHVYISQNMTHLPIWKTFQSCRQVTTLKIKIVTMKTKLLVPSWIM